MTYPEIKAFFDDYVIGGKPLPFEEVLAYAGVNYTRVDKEKAFSFGQCELGYNPATHGLVVTGVKNMNDFGKALGYQVGDEIEKVNGKKVSAMGFRMYRQDWLRTVKEGDKVTISVLRKSAKGKAVKKTLKTKAFKSEVRLYNTIDFTSPANAEQLRMRKAWLDGVRQ